MNDRTEDERAFLLLAAASEPETPERSARDRLTDALREEPFLPFAAELSRWFSLSLPDMRALLRRIQDPEHFKPGLPPTLASMDFRPGPALAPLRGGFVRMQSGMWLPRHRHTHREVTIVLAGELADGEGHRFLPGDAVDMAEGTVHTLGAPATDGALVAILHGRIELLGD